MEKLRINLVSWEKLKTHLTEREPMLKIGIVLLVFL